MTPSPSKPGRLRTWLRDARAVLRQGDPRPVRLISGLGAVALGVTVILDPVTGPGSPAALSGVYAWTTGLLSVASGLLLMSRPRALNGRTVTGALLSSAIYAGLAVLLYAAQNGWGRAVTIYAGLALTALWLTLRATPVQIAPELLREILPAGSPLVAGLPGAATTSIAFVPPPSLPADDAAPYVQ